MQLQKYRRQELFYSKIREAKTFASLDKVSDFGFSGISSMRQQTMMMMTTTTTTMTMTTKLCVEVILSIDVGHNDEVDNSDRGYITIEL